MICLFYNDSNSYLTINTMESDINSYKKGSWFKPYNLSIGDRNAYPRLAVKVSGNSIYTAAVWVNYNGSNTVIHSVTGLGTLLSPPSNLSVEQKIDDLGVFKEYYNVLRWQPSSSSEVAGYVIFRNGHFLVQVDSDVLEYIDHNRTQNESISYGVAAVDQEVHQSSVVNIHFPPQRSDKVIDFSHDD